ncbi:MAG: Tfp pilus assembly protein FimT/FimU [Parachlamydiaceae bacterium]
MTIQSIRKSPFTLLEVMVVLFIISLAMILTGVKVKSIYQDQRFFSETEQVLSHLSMAQDLMLIMDTDVKVYFAPDKKGKEMELWLDIEKPIEEAWARLVERKMTLQAIGRLEFDGHSTKELTLQFSLGKMSKGELVLFEGDERKFHKQKESRIQLLGYPAPIGEKKGAFQEQTKSEMSQLLYPAAVYEDLYQEANKEKNPKA